MPTPHSGGFPPSLGVVVCLYIERQLSPSIGVTPEGLEVVFLDPIIPFKGWIEGYFLDSGYFKPIRSLSNEPKD